MTVILCRSTLKKVYPAEQAYSLGAIADYISRSTAIVDELVRRELERDETVSNGGSGRQERKKGEGEGTGKGKEG